VIFPNVGEVCRILFLFSFWVYFLFPIYLARLLSRRWELTLCQGCSYSPSLLARIIYIFRDFNGVLLYKVSGFSYGTGFCEHLYTNC
jgi:hypothetical protein